MLAATRDLLVSLDPLSYPQRMKHLVAWARTAPDRAEVCADLRSRGSYERHLALVAAVVTRDVEGVEAATRDPYASIRASALNAALRIGSLNWSILELSAMERRRIYRTLRRLNAPEIADALLSEVRSHYGDEEAAALLPACSPATIRALLPELEHALNLERLVNRHPGLVLDRAGERLAQATPELRDRIWAEVGRAVLRCDPARALELLERYAPEKWLPGNLTAYGVLAAYDPGRVVTLLSAPSRSGWLRRISLPRALLRRLAVLSVEQLAPLARQVRECTWSLAALLDAVPPARRGDLYDRALADVETALLVPAREVMEVLPVAVRIREASRVLGLAKIREREAQVLLWSAYLAWPDAAAALDAAVGSGDADERAQTYVLLVEAARRSRDPQAVAEVVTRLGRLRNEQDPVRVAALTALAKVARLLTPGAAAGLAQLTSDAVEARDASAATTAALSTLAVDTLQHHVDVPELREWALATIDMMGTSARVPLLRRFDGVLRRGQETMVVRRLHDWVETAAGRGEYGPLFALTHALGRRAWRVPQLQEMLRRAIHPRTSAGVAEVAIRLWLDDPRSRGERVAEVLATDPSTVTIPVVWETICSSRTDLLDRVFNRHLLDRVFNRHLRGRFIEAGTRWVPGSARHPERWLPRQHAAFVALQERIIVDADATVWQRAAAIHAAARMPGLGRAVVLRHVDASEVVIAEAALGALVWGDRPDEALPVLLEYAGGDRARVALYAAGRAARHVPPAQLPVLLGGVLFGPAKITSRKAAVRLLARYGSSEVMATLLQVYTQPDTHRDVRAAVVAAARQRLDAEPSWTILDAAGNGSREERRAVLAGDPHLVPERHRPRYAALIVAACRVVDREVRRAAFAQLPAWSYWAADVSELILDRLTDLGEQSQAIEITQLLRALGDAGIRSALVRLVERDTGDELPGDELPADDLRSDAAADRPARRRVEAIALATVVWSRISPAGTDRSGPIAAARWLAGQPGYTGAAAAMLVGLGQLDNLDEIADLCARRPVLAVRTAEHVGSRLRELPESIDPATLPDMIDRLIGRGDLAGGLFAMALVRPGATFGWSSPWRDLLLRLRQHPDADVREEAYGVDMS
ncbi:hypothetical protein FHR38_000055 [Micromonospora polyrhachis]|uniref:HEAT repeat protein n=1 Tax=Micromonospora polyrhachis TaxID=1282883 RepID=A0A7W7SLC0_9ACTN|nr:hypothetical protein [Micromonospora polyrhachis]